MKNKMRKTLSKIAMLSTAMAFAIGGALALNCLETNAEDAKVADITEQTITQRIYQGENNWYYLTGDFSENELYRMYYNTAYGWWQGYGHLGCSIGGDYNTAYPTNADVMLAYVIPEFGNVKVGGRTILNNMESEKAIDAKIVHRSIDGTDTYIYNASVSDTSVDGVAFEQQTIEAKAGDVIFFVAETNSNLEAWDGITFDATIEITKMAGKSEEVKNVLNATTMPLTGAHTVTVTNNMVDAQDILTESMKLKQNASDRQKYAYRGTDGNYALFAYDATAAESGNPYRLSELNFGDCSTGIEQYRVFYANNGWTGASGMIYYIPANGYTSVFGKAVVNGTCDIVKVSAGGVTTLVKTLSAGTYDFSQVTEVNNIPVNMGDFVGVFFDGGAWTTSSFVGAFDFYVHPTVAMETVGAFGKVEMNYNGNQAKIVDLKLDGQAYEPGFIYDEETHTLTFKVETVSGYEVDYVSCNGAILSAVDGVYEVPFVKGVEISIATRAAYAYKASLSLSGDIAMNFFLHISDEAMQAEGAKVIFTFKGEETEVALTDGIKSVEDGVDCYKFSYGVSAKDYDKPVQITVVVPEREGARYEYSISNYADTLLAMEGESYESAKSLVKELVNYCKAAKAYFYKTGETVALTQTVTVDDLEEYKAKSEGESEKVSDCQVLISLQSTTAIRVSYKATEPVVVKVDGQEVTDVVDNGDGTYSFEINNIAAKDLNKVYVIEIDSFKVEYSAMSYVYTVLASMSEEENSSLFTVVKAAYLYNLQADNYFNNK